MHLIGLPRIRIKQYPKGYVVEIQKRTWYGRKFWTHLISVAGMNSKPWFFNSYESALDEAVLYFKYDLMWGSQIFN